MMHEIRDDARNPCYIPPHGRHFSRGAGSSRDTGSACDAGLPCNAGLPVVTSGKTTTVVEAVFSAGLPMRPLVSKPHPPHPHILPSWGFEFKEVLLI